MAVTLVAMTQEQFDAYMLVSVRDYAQSFVDAGILSAEAAARRSESDFERLLDQGLDTPYQHLFTAYDADEPIGVLWLYIPDESAEPADGPPTPPGAYVYDVSVHEDKRRRGYGRAIMQAGMAESRARGAESLRLNVFGHNDGAKALYEQLGFKVTSTQMKLDL